ncbi:hypothetical protein NDU88_007771 [Pleurodeles waltl]|uniref:Uncharacterized protein n=1 Tax=Pleurodeles waltl TaxID=8319 RepID=A0AAV7QSN9_PLEWA|nr:hypothetical protein NDU88_007771 [Pleurodeles waltl]
MWRPRACLLTDGNFTENQAKELRLFLNHNERHSDLIWDTVGDMQGHDEGGGSLPGLGEPVHTKITELEASIVVIKKEGPTGHTELVRNQLAVDRSSQRQLCLNEDHKFRMTMA